MYVITIVTEVQLCIHNRINVNIIKMQIVTIYITLIEMTEMIDKNNRLRSK